MLINTWYVINVILRGTSIIVKKIQFSFSSSFFVKKKTEQKGGGGGGACCNGQSLSRRYFEVYLQCNYVITSTIIFFVCLSFSVFFVFVGEKSLL